MEVKKITVFGKNVVFFNPLVTQCETMCSGCEFENDRNGCIFAIRSSDGACLTNSQIWKNEEHAPAQRRTRETISSSTIDSIIASLKIAV